MGKAVHTYSRAGAVRTAGFSAAVMGLSGLVLFLTASERLRCERLEGRPPECQLERIVAGVVVWARELEGVESASVEDSTRPVGEATEDDYPTYWLRIFTESGSVASVQNADRSACTDAARGLDAFLRDRRQRLFEVTLPGQPKAVPWALGVFAFGAVLPPLWLLGLLFPWMRPQRR